jgi:hypothetical protein
MDQALEGQGGIDGEIEGDHFDAPLSLRRNRPQKIDQCRRI